jgi:predicted small integral membrane protein
MFNLACHERITILLKDAQAGTRAKVDLFTAILSAGILRWIFEFATTGGFVFGQWRICSFNQSSFFLLIGIMSDVPYAK